MHQVLLNLRGYALHAYGVLIACGFFLGIVLAARDARRVSSDGTRAAERMLDMCFWVLVMGLVGSRLLYVIVNIPEYVSSCREGIATGDALFRCTGALHVWEGGLVF